MRRETFATPGPVSLTLNVPAGEVVLETSETAETIVELEPMRDNDESIDAVDSARIEMRERAAGGQDIRVAIEKGGGFGWFGRAAEVRLRVHAPRRASVDLETASADVRGVGEYGDVRARVASSEVEFENIDGEAQVNGASGDIKLGRIGGRAAVNTASGDVELGDVAGAAEVNTASGDVVVRHAGGPVEVNSASGDVVVGEAESGARIRTASGDQRLDAVSAGEVELASASGDVRVGVRRGSKLWVDAQSRSGDVSSEFDVGESAPHGDGPLVELRARSMSGDIHVARA